MTLRNSWVIFNLLNQTRIFYLHPFLKKELFLLFLQIPYLFNLRNRLGNVCGISGIFGLEDRELTRKMIETLKIRGPENTDYAVTDIGSVANARLSIIDVAGGNQPIWNKENTVCIVANCEIYNFREIRQELERKYEFKTQTDTEVILYAYQEYGLDFAQKIDGIFAVAILDLVNRKLVLARDRLGIKPLYYWSSDDILLFGSEIKAILQYEEVLRLLNLYNLHIFLQLGYVFRERTLFAGIQQMLPGTVMVVSSTGTKTHTYWKPDNSETKDLDIDFLSFLIEKSIESQLISERPLGVYLSGGLDSSIVAAFAARKIENLTVFTQDFGAVSEVDQASLVADSIGAEHYTKEFDPETEIRHVREMLYAMEHPTFELSPTYDLAKYARSKGNIVMLSGLGGDELFGGYVPHERALKIGYFPNLGLISKATGAFFDTIGSNRLARYSLAFGNHLSKILAIKTSEGQRRTRSLFNFEQKPIRWKNVLEFNPNANFFKVMESELIYSQLEGNYLRIADRMSMAASLEMRVPLLHTPLVEYALHLPVSAKIKDNVSKFALRKIAREKLNLPRKIVKRGERARNKGGYGFSPVDFWNRGLDEYVKSQLDANKIREYGVFSEQKVKKYLDKPKSFVNIRILWHMAATHDLIDLFGFEGFV